MKTVKKGEEGKSGGVIVIGMGIGVIGMGKARTVMTMYGSMEIVTICSYIITGKGTREKGKEEGWKYIIIGTITSSWILIGLTGRVQETGEGEMAGTLILEIGLYGKLGVVPWQIWWPRVYTGTKEEGNWLLITIGKGILMWVLYTQVRKTSRIYDVEESEIKGWSILVWNSYRLDSENIQKVVGGWSIVYGLMKATGGVRIKQIIGYSTIGHTGYMLYAIRKEELYMYISWYGVVLYSMYTGWLKGISWHRKKELKKKDIHGSCVCMRDLKKSAPHPDPAKGKWKIKIGRLKGGERIRKVRKGEKNREEKRCITILLWSNMGVPPVVGFTIKWEIWICMVTGKREGWSLIYLIGTVLGIKYTLRLISELNNRKHS